MERSTRGRTRARAPAELGDRLPNTVCRAESMDEALSAALEQGATLITANRRLSAHLRNAYDIRRHANGQLTWPSPDILPLGAWVRRCWEAGAERAAERDGEPPPPLLSDAAQEVLWERIVSDSEPGRGLLDPAAAAGLAVEAHHLRHQWGTEALSLEAIAAGGGAEGRAFAAWSREAAAWCQTHGWNDPAAQLDTVAQWLGAGLIDPPPAIRYTGFDDLTPQVERLLAALRAAGCDVAEYAPAAPPGDAGLATFDDPGTELEATARWARALLEAAGPGELAPGAIGIVTPHLQGMRGEIERVFRDVLTPGCDLREPGAAEPFNLSLGASLSGLPPIRDALALLHPWHAPLHFETAAGLLRSPFIAGGSSELAARGRLDAQLRKDRRPELRWRDLLRAAKRTGADDSGPAAPRLAAALRAVERIAGDLPSTAPPTAWADTFTAILQAFHWPAGDRGLSSAEHQAAEAWQELLAEFARLEIVLPRLGWAEATARLGWLAARRVFQPQRETAPVQILGVLEAGGLPFAHLWLLGFDDASWPPAPRPNPFLPLRLQRDLNLPHASAARELAFARRETARLLAGAPRIVVSHPRLRENRAVGPAPLLSGLPPLEAGALPRSTALHPAAAVQAAAPPLERFGDGAVPVLPPLEAGETHRGGVALFTDQSACPFRAFAVHRLDAGPLETPEPGLSAADRGTIVHKALELAWGRLKDHKTLCAQSAGELTALSARVADEAVAAFAERHPGSGPAALDLERERIAALLADFLQLEKHREPFTVVATEAKHEASFGGLTVDTKVDRIDRLDASPRAHVLIDYKTGDAQRSSWYGVRPREPQLPLYCASGGMEVAALAFARVSRRHLDFQAVGASKELLPGAVGFDKVPRPDMGEPYSGGAEVIADWRAMLESLGRGFREGAPVADPRRPPQDSGSPCQYCHLPLLCRLADWADGADAGGDGGQGGGSGDE